jgi:MATE family multidrug resistance protein
MYRQSTESSGGLPEYDWRMPLPNAGAVPSPPDVTWANVFRLAAPAVIDGLLSMTIGVTGLLLVGRLGDTALAGMGAALQLVWFAISFGTAIGTGTTVSVAQAIGRGDRDGAKQATVQATILAVCAGAVVTALTPYSRELVAILGGANDVTEQGAAYVRVCLATSLVLIVPAVMGGALRGAGDTRTPMLAGVVANTANLLMTPALVFGLWGFPILGVSGAAIGATVGRGLGGVVMAAVLLAGRRAVDLPWRGVDRHRWRPSLAMLKRLSSLSLPTALEQFQSTTAILLFGMLVLAEGTAVSAAQRVVFNLMGIAYLPAIGCATAATILVGQAFGAGVPWPGGAAAIRATTRSYALALGWLSATGAIFVSFAPDLVALYTGVPAVLAPGVPGLRIIGVYLPIASVGIVYGAALRGAGDTRSPMVISALSMWLITLPVAWTAGRALETGLPGLLIAFCLSGVVSGASLWARWRAVTRGLGAETQESAVAVLAHSALEAGPKMS